MDQTLLYQLHAAGFPPSDAITVRNGPSLEELIQACGKDFVELAASDDGSGDWSAMAPGYPVGSIEGKSPSEAVARLWLALNPKGV